MEECKDFRQPIAKDHSVEDDISLDYYEFLIEKLGNSCIEVYKVSK